MIKLVLALAAASLGFSSALAQSTDTVPPPSRYVLDDNGVNLATGEQFMTVTEVKIGAADAGLALNSIRGVSGNGSNFSQYVYANGSTWSASVPTATGARTYRFTLAGGVYTSITGEQATFAGSGGSYVLTLADGSQYTYAGPVGATADGPYRKARLTQIIDSDGTKQTLTYNTAEYCAVNNQEPCQLANQRSKIRLQSVANSYGYQLLFSYVSNQTTTAQQGANWDKLKQVTAFNLAVDYCDPAAFTCTFTQTWPTALYTGTPGAVESVTAFGETSTYTRTGGSGTPVVYKVKRPGASTDNIVVTLDTSGRPSSIVNEGRTFGYSWSVAGSLITAVITNPDSSTRTVISDTNVGLPTSVKDELNRTTTYQYDTSGRLTRATAPEGNYVQYGYNDTTMRGNLTETRVVSKTPGTPADIVTTAGYPTSCPNAKTCNQPSWTKDARNNQTDYTYDATHGGVATVTLPAVMTNGVSVRPQTRFGYTALQAYFKNAAGSIVASGVTAYRLTSTSACQSTASCANTADETRAVTSYGPQTAGTANNLLPISVTRGSGAAFQAGDTANLATTTLSYDNIGQNTFVDGPLPGTADTTRLIYNVKQQNVGLIGPDPDGAGTMKNRAARITCNADGQVTQVERGTTNGQSDTDWTAFVSLQQQLTSYDSYARPSAAYATAGGTTYTATQYGYDNRGRQICVAQRMNSAIFGSLPTDACQLGTMGSFGSDRITKTTFDVANEVTKTTSAYLTADAADDATLTYTSNGKLQTLTDANGNLTTYEYDGVDRVAKQRYPQPSTPGSSSTTDYDGSTYDPAGNVTSRRIRDGRAIAYTFDALNRVTLKDVPPGGYFDNDVTYNYDNFGRLTNAGGAVPVSFGYDALGRTTSEQSVLGTKSMSYDLGNRMTRLSYPDGFAVGYDHLVTGEVSLIRENPATPGPQLAGYAYDDLGRRSSITRLNGSSTTYQYDAVSRLTQLAHDFTGTTYDSVATFTYNPASQIATRTQSNDLYAYSLANQDVAETPNGLNQLTTQGGTGLSYDGMGNVSAIGTNTYSYTSENRLATTPPGWMAYDQLGRLYQKSASSVVQEFDYVGAQAIAKHDASYQPIEHYVWGPGTDELLVTYSGTGLATRIWAAQDERISVIALADGTGTVTTVNKYDDYGVPAPSNAGVMQYTGQLWLPEIGISYYKARMYAPGFGRFMQSDPIGYAGGNNLYAYVGGDPVNMTDPSGLTTDDICTGTRLCPKSDGGGGPAGLFGLQNLARTGGGGSYFRFCINCGPQYPDENGLITAAPVYASYFVPSAFSSIMVGNGNDDGPTFLTPFKCGGWGLLAEGAGDAFVNLGGAAVAVGGTGAAVGTGLGILGAATGNVPAAGVGAIIAAPSTAFAALGGVAQAGGAAVSFLGGNSLRNLAHDASGAIIDRLPLPSPIAFATKQAVKAFAKRIPDVRICDRGY